MTDVSFFVVFFENIYFFCFLMLFCMSMLYFSVRNISLAGCFDPIHFYWTFTFGTAYGIVTGLFFLGHISSYLFFVIFLYGMVFICALRIFLLVPAVFFRLSPSRFLIPQRRGSFEFVCLLLVYLCTLTFIANFVGFGMFAETNRFEQNRGYGAFVRLADAIGPFVTAYIALVVYRRIRLYGFTIKSSLLVLFLVFIILFGAILNGAKFALLGSVYTIFVAISIFDVRPRFKISHLLFVFISALFFALATLSMNLDRADFDRSAGPSYIGGESVLLERLVLRIIANADKYYFSLPGDVIEELETDSALVRFAAPIVGVTQLSSYLGYEVNLYDVGKQIIMHFYPAHDVAGGPTSHFDLFTYKYFGLEFGWIFVIFIAFLLSAILRSAAPARGNIYYSSLVAALWVRSLAVLLEPTIGVAYVLDLVIIFSIIKLCGLLIPRRSFT